MSTTDTPKRAAIYARISLDHEKERLGVTRQAEICRELAERSGWTVVKVYEDNNVSASSFAKRDRPQFAEMLRAVEAGEIDGIVSYSMDRLSRRVRQVLDLVDLAQRCSVPILTVQGGMDLSTKQGIAFAQMAAIFAEQEVGIKSERHLAANAQRYALGKHFGRSIPFGYMRKGKGDIQIDPAIEPHLREAFKRVQDGATSLGDLIELFESRGIRPKSGKRWNYTSMHKVITGPVYAGILLHNGIEVPDVETNWDPYITRDEHRAILAVLAGRARKYAKEGKRSPRSEYLLSGLLRCSCPEGRHMTGGKRGDKERIYICSGREQGLCARTVLVSTADTEVEAYVVNRLNTLTPDSVLDPETLARQRAISDELLAIERERAEYVADKSLTRQALRDMLRRCDDDAHALTEELGTLVQGNVVSGLLAHVLGWVGSGEAAKAMQVSASSVRDAYRDLTNSQKRLVAEFLGEYRHKPMGKGRKTEVEVFPRDLGTGEALSQYTPDGEDNPRAFPWEAIKSMGLLDAET